MNARFFNYSTLNKFIVYLWSKRTIYNPIEPSSTNMRKSIKTH
jgi:hypothetical protein